MTTQTPDVLENLDRKPQPTFLQLVSCGRLIGIFFMALMFAVIVGSMSFAGATDFNLGLIEGIVCPDDSQLVYRLGELETIESFPSETNPIGDMTSGRAFSVRCIDQGEVVASGNGLLLRTIGTILGGYFLVCFLPLLLGTSILLTIIQSKISRNSQI